LREFTHNGVSIIRRLTFDKLPQTVGFEERWGQVKEKMKKGRHRRRGISLPPLHSTYPGYGPDQVI